MIPEEKLTFSQLYQSFRDTDCAPARESLPERWIDLLRYLDQREREEGLQTKPQGRAR